MQAKPVTPALHDPHATLRKFGYPHTLVHRSAHWALLVRPAQPTLGSLVLCAIGEETRYGDLPEAAFAEQKILLERVEDMLKSLTAYDKLNYLMLMMVDPHVHFHIIPRFASERRFDGEVRIDQAWPGYPDLSTTFPASDRLIQWLRDGWSA